MSKSLRSFAEPKMLAWALRTSHLTREYVADRLRVTPDVIDLWLSGKEEPTFAQLKAFAALCKRPTALFFLKEYPQDFSVIQDFRRISLSDSGEMSPQLAFAIRAAHERQVWLREFLESE